MHRVLTAFLAVIAAVAGTVASARADGFTNPPSHRCVTTTVKRVTPRLEGMSFQQSGVSVTFNTHLGLAPTFPNAFASVTHYQGDPEDAIMAKEHPGDRVRVCFLYPPTPSQFCHPQTDSRGRVYRVYDFRQRASYSGMNSEHDCGGA